MDTLIRVEMVDLYRYIDRVEMVDLYGYIDQGRDSGPVWIH